jgi:hypothetical protein
LRILRTINSQYLLEVRAEAAAAENRRSIKERQLPKAGEDGVVTFCVEGSQKGPSKKVHRNRDPRKIEKVIRED